jgi:hypothetical protein
MTNSSPRLLIKSGTLIDGSGRDPVRNTLVVVEGNRISHVGRGDGSLRPESPDDTVVDAAGKFILPGLIDAHCHISLHQGALPGVRYTSSAEFCTLWAVHAIGRVLRAGVTGIAVPGGKWFTDVTVREAVEAGLLEGPRMVVAGRALGNYGGIFDPDPYPAYEGTPADAAGVQHPGRVHPRDPQAMQARGQPDQDRRFHLGAISSQSPRRRSPRSSMKPTGIMSRSRSTRAARLRPALLPRPASIWSTTATGRARRTSTSSPRPGSQSRRS